jgi:hypothetical protein
MQHLYPPTPTSKKKKRKEEKKKGTEKPKQPGSRKRKGWLANNSNVILR